MQSALTPGARAALRARSLLEERFFVAPSRIAQLCAELQHTDHPWLPRMLELATADRERGIAVYGGLGPRLGADFPWGRLPAGPGHDSLHAKRPHRFAFAPRSGLASINERAASIALHDTLAAWMACADSGCDPMCYDSNLGVIQRMLALSWCWAFLAARAPRPEPDGLELELQVLRILQADVSFLEPRLGRSVPNNHLLADWFAGWFMQQVMPEFLNQPRDDYERRFREELLRQTYPDGGSFEHSAHYHEFACEMGAAYLLLCRRHGRIPDPDIEQRVRVLLRFQSSITGSECRPLPFGNAVEDTLFPLDPGEAWCAGSLREIERALFRPELPPAPVRETSVARAYWLLEGDFAPSTTPRAPIADAGNFPDAGFHVHEDADLDARLIFRTGPAEHAELMAGHMHADFLSVYLSVAGDPIIVDAGTYTYRLADINDVPIRRYLAGPAAHNSLCIESEDPLGALRGDFRERHTNARVRQRQAAGGGLRWTEGQILDGGSYTGQVRGCIHVHGHYWVIYDRAPERANHDPARWYGFQLAPGLEPRTTGALTEIALANAGRHLSILTSLAMTPTLIAGSTDPLGGWWSPRYGELLAAPQLRYPALEDTSPSVFVISHAGILSDSAAAEIEIAGTDALSIRLPRADGEDRLLLNAAPAPHGLVTDDDLAFDGKLLWLRIENGRVRALRWLAGRRLAWAAHDLCAELAGDQADVTLESDINDTAHTLFRTLNWPRH